MSGTRGVLRSFFQLPREATSQLNNIRPAIKRYLPGVRRQNFIYLSTQMVSFAKHIFYFFLLSFIQVYSD